MLPLVKPMSLTSKVPVVALQPRPSPEMSIPAFEAELNRVAPKYVPGPMMVPVGEERETRQLWLKFGVAKKILTLEPLPDPEKFPSVSLYK